MVLKEPLSSSGPHLEGHHFSGQKTPAEAGAAMATKNAPTRQIATHVDFFIFASSSYFGVIRTALKDASSLYISVYLSSTKKLLHHPLAPLYAFTLK
jgi:hypothetical protein